MYHAHKKWFNFETANEGGNDKEHVRRNRAKNTGDETTLIINYESDLKLLSGRLSYYQ